MLFQQAQQRLAASDAEAERLRAKCEEATARSRAFCSGYKWVVRGLLRGGEGGELSDADALDTVQLTQRLDQEVLAQKHLLSCRREGAVYDTKRALQSRPYSLLRFLALIL